MSKDASSSSPLKSGKKAIDQAAFDTISNDSPPSAAAEVDRKRDLKQKGKRANKIFEVLKIDKKQSTELDGSDSED